MGNEAADRITASAAASAGVTESVVAVDETTAAAAAAAPSSSCVAPPDSDGATTTIAFPVRLDSRFLYQNSVTGQVSRAATLSARQLCKILCPSEAAAAAAAAQVGGGTDAVAAAEPPHPRQRLQRLRHITPDTHVLLQLHDGSYAAEWKPAREVPILREASTLWYVYLQHSGNSGDNEHNNQNKTIGPVSCRTLAGLRRMGGVEEGTVLEGDGQALPAATAAAVGSSSSGSTTEGRSLVQVSSALTQQQWMPIEFLPHLLDALQVFTKEQPPPPTPPMQQQQQQIDVVSTTETIHANDRDEKRGESAGVDGPAPEDVQAELEAFLASTGGGHPFKADYVHNDYDDDDYYESDGGTRYPMNDHQRGNLSHEALTVTSARGKRKVPSAPGAQDASTAATSDAAAQDPTEASSRKKQKKAKFSARKQRCWAYVTGLPLDCTEEEIAERFAKAGILDLDPETQKPKVKLYRHRDGPNAGRPKGDASICFARPESVELAITLLDEAPLRLSDAVQPNTSPMMRVQPAKFEQHGDRFDAARVPRISNAQRKVAKMASAQAVDWDEGEINGRLTGGRKGLRIIVLKHIFHPTEVAEQQQRDGGEDRYVEELQRTLRDRLEQYGVVEKITVFVHNPAGVVVVKFAQPGAASDAVRGMNGTTWNNSSTQSTMVEASFWDGVTDYTIRSEASDVADMEQRQEEFGNWLESQELPEELQLRTET
jgi:HIV Tat-specific factor 1